jgi:hypothetical protein
MAFPNVYENKKAPCITPGLFAIMKERSAYEDTPFGVINAICSPKAK